MKKTTAWLLTAVLLIVAGGVIFSAAMTALGWDFMRLNTNSYETNTYTFEDAVENITIETDVADIRFVTAQDGRCEVVCYEREDETHTVKVENGTLLVETTDNSAWYHHIGFDFGAPEITLYLPQENYAAVKIETSTGDIAVENLSAGTLALTVSTGRVTAKNIHCAGNMEVYVSTGETELTGVRCGSLTSEGSTGNIILTDVVAESVLSVQRSTGDVMFSGCDAAEITVQTDTGDVKGWLLSEKVFMTETDTGRVDVPKTAAGGICTVTTDTGDIQIKMKQIAKKNAIPQNCASAQKMGMAFCSGTGGEASGL